ncbi:MAG: PhoU domain-containing protein [Bacteroidota bacterium]
MGFLDSIFRENDFPPLVSEASDEIHEMVRRGRYMFEAATGHLLENEVLEEDLSKMDELINNGEQHIRRVVFEHLSFHPEQDLIFCLKLVSIVNEAERIGDLAKSIAKVANMANQPRMGALVRPLRDFRDIILEMFLQLEEGFFRGNEDEAQQIMQKHQTLKGDVAAYIINLASEENLSGNQGVVYALSARMLNRVSAHIANIASTVVSPIDQIRRTAAWPEDE